MMPISLNAGNIETLTLGGSVVFTHDTEAIGSSGADYLGNTLTVTFTQGTPASNTFATDARAKNHTLTINLTAGTWNTSIGSSGTLGSPALTALNTNVRNFKNAMETIANNIGLIPGTVVAWS